MAKIDIPVIVPKTCILCASFEFEPGEKYDSPTSCFTCEDHGGCKAGYEMDTGLASSLISEWKTK